MLAQEPWCFTPDQIARLTDWQVVSLYLVPAAERAEKLRAGTGGGPAGPVPRHNTPDAEPGTEGHRRQIVAALMSHQGLSRERAEAAYESQLAAYHAQQGG